jgi:predicted ATPase
VASQDDLTIQPHLVRLVAAELLYQRGTPPQATGAVLGQPRILALLAEAYGQAAQPEAGLEVLTEALAAVEKTGERWYEVEIYRLQGVLLQQQSRPDTSQAETCYQKALEIARHQHTKAWELRTATSLARL